MRVLVVEDAPVLAEVVAEGLRDQGMAVDVATDGRIASEKLDLHPYDVVVLDRDLPGIHGDTLCRRITARDPRPMVLMLTAAGSPDDRVEGLTLGADDYLSKPFHFPELVLRCRSLARRRPAARGRVLRGAGLELDPQRHTATRDGIPLALSVKEFEVLLALLRAAPGHLSAEALLEQVWDEHADPFTNTVTVTIGRLRRKLGDPPVIRTTPRVGYRLCDSEPVPVRIGTAVDVPGCLDVADKVLPPDRARWERGLTESATDPARMLHVAEDAGRIVGYARTADWTRPAGAPPNAAPSGWYLLGLVVDPGHRRRGIGDALTTSRLDAIRARGATEVWYFANARNTASLDLHTRLGFVEVTRDFWFPDLTFDGGEGVLARLSLSPR